MSQLGERNEDEQKVPDPPEGEKVLPAADLFGDRREVVIDHEGERYRLRITRRGKLILQK